MDIYSVNPKTFDVLTAPDSATPLPPEITNLSGTSFVATDIQGRSVVLGAPTKVTIQNSTPTIINAAPPMHVDYIKPVGGAKPEVLNISFIPDGFNSAFLLSQQSKTGGATTGKLSWSAGVDLSVEGDFQISDTNDGTGAKFSAGFDVAEQFTHSSDNSTINYVANSFGVSAATGTGDVVFFDDSRFNIWVYPVLGKTVCPKGKTCPPDQLKPLTVQFSGPDEIDTTFVSAEILSAFWYQPPWEWGNVFSYPATKDQLALIYPDISGQTTLSNDVTFVTDGSDAKIQASWSSGTEKGETVSTTNSASADVTTSYTESVGISTIAQGKISTSLKLSGSTGFEHLQTYTSQVDSSNGIEILASGGFRDPGNYSYKVKPYILSSFPPSGVGDSQQPPKADIQKFGPLKTAFTADPTATTGGGAWWSQAYTRSPDVSLNHPSRWILSTPAVRGTLPANCANSGKTSDCFDIAPFFDDDGKPLNPWVSNFYSMRGFFITSADNPGAGPQLGFARAGDKLDLAVRVYNYSLAQMPAGTMVHVRFTLCPGTSATTHRRAIAFSSARTPSFQFRLSATTYAHR